MVHSQIRSAHPICTRCGSPGEVLPTGCGCSLERLDCALDFTAVTRGERKPQHNLSHILPELQCPVPCPPFEVFACDFTWGRLLAAVSVITPAAFSTQLEKAA